MPDADLAVHDEMWMQRAIELAQVAAANDEVPVGAIVVANDTQEVLGEGFNQPISGADPSAHAEVIALRAAAKQRQNYRLVGTTLYVTIEPCMMCAGAMLHARIDRLVFGAAEPKAGAVVSHALLGTDWQNHKVAVTGGVLSEVCAELMSSFFASKRKG